MDPTRPRILIVDDDREIRRLLADYLGGHGFDALVAEDGRAMRQMLDRQVVDLIILDLNLPGADGLSLCRDLRAGHAVPIIMLTARAEPIDRILGLEMGADDYLAKPFEPRELVARVRNILRRRDGREAPEAVSARRMLFAGRIFDLERRLLVARDGRVVILSGAEFRFLKALADRPGQVISRDQLARLGANRQTEPTDRGVDLQISRLRAKLGDDARMPELIRTVRSRGYVLAVPVTREL